MSDAIPREKLCEMLDKAEAAVTAKQSEIMQLQGNNDELREAISNAGDERDELETKIEKLTFELNKSKGLLTALGTANAKIDELGKALAACREHYTLEYAKLSKLQDEALAKIDRKQEVIKSMWSEHVKEVSEIDQLKTENEALRKEVAYKCETITNVLKENKELKAELISWLGA